MKEHEQLAQRFVSLFVWFRLGRWKELHYRLLQSKTRLVLTLQKSSNNYVTAFI